MRLYPQNLTIAQELLPLSMVDSSSNMRQKITDIAKHIGDLFRNQDEEFKRSIGQAGTIGALIKIGFDIYDQIQQDRQTEDEKAFNSLFKVVFTAAKESISKKGMENIPTNNWKNKEIREQFFQMFSKKREWNLYLPNHSTVVEFRKFICDILQNEGHNNLVRDFVFEFNISLDDIIDRNDQDVRPFIKWSLRDQALKRIIRHLEYSRSLMYKVSPTDERYLAEYYVENDSVIADVANEWDKEDNYFVSYYDNSLAHKFKGKESKASKLVMDNILKSNKRYIVIGAPFGIGKTSLSIYLTSLFASMYLEYPQNIQGNPIPIFVPLKGKLNIIDENDTSLEEKLEQISSGVSGKNKNLVLICDGLDEYGGDVRELKQSLERLKLTYQNMRFIITTRLEAGVPTEIGISSYIRLLPFNNDQVDEFFRLYGLPEFNSKSLHEYNLHYEEISKPLFCWMFTTMINSKFYDHSLLRESSEPSMTRSFIYEGFIHSIIRGKHRSVADQLSITQFYDDEKRILRKVAALRQMNEPKILTRNMVMEQLKYYYGDRYSERELQKQIIEPILTSYFYLQGPTISDKTIDFIHKSFREFLLAEYYIESILADKRHYLNVGIPTPETMQFIAGLIGILKSDETANERLKDYINSIIKTFVPIEDQQQCSRSSILEKIRKNAQKFFEEEQMVYNMKEQPSQDNIWRIYELPISKYSNLIIHRWISLYVIGNITPRPSIDLNLLVDFIVNSLHNIPIELRHQIPLGFDLYGANLAGADLVGADLYGANLSMADLVGANLQRAFLVQANLVSARLRNAYLARTSLSGANLTAVNLSEAYLFQANLYGAILVEADLTGAYLAGANLSGANLSGADLSGANLFRANLSGADLTGSRLVETNLCEANLSGANLFTAKMDYANLREAKTDDRTKLPNYFRSDITK